MGSPPRVRGKVGHAVVVPRPVGITPACAGKRRTADRRRHRRGDHPRVCGEKWSMMVPQTLTRGSPPRVRGKGMSNGCVLLCRGITPACAGKSLQQARRRSAAGDHPRVCGEKTLYSGIRRVVLGSPPRVRGKVVAHSRVLLDVGITPACAGKRGCDHQRQNRARDHPRVCGEKTKKIP